MTLAAGSRIGPYEIQALLGAGDMGPLNLVFRTCLGMFHIGTRRLATGEKELRQVLELDENFWIAHLWLCTACVVQGRWTEALTLAEKAYSVVPRNWFAVGLLAGILEHAGDTSRSKLLQEKFGSGDAYGAPSGLFCFHAVLSEWELAVSWFEKAVSQHDTRAPWILPRIFGDRLTSSQYWPALARKMNLPVKA